MTNLALELIQSPLIAFSVVAMTASVIMVSIKDRKERRK